MRYDISIILPAYNCESSIENTIQSIICQQSDLKIEIVIVNDGSSDNTLYICKKIAEKYNFIKVIDIKNSGPSEARNVAIQSANAKYIMFIDADDTYENGMIKKMYNSIENVGVGIVVCNYKIVNNLNVKNNIKIDNFKYNEIIDIEDYHIEQLMKMKTFNVIWNKIYVLDVIRENNLIFNSNIELGEDFRFNIDYFKCINKMIVLDEYLYRYSITDNSICGKYRKNLFELKLENIKYQEQNQFAMDYINNKYIDCLKSSIISIIENGCSLKETISKIKVQSKKILELMKINKKNKLNKLNNIIFILMKYKLYFLLFCFIDLIIKIKKIVSKFKKNIYR